MELLKTWLLLACVAGSYAAPLSGLSSDRHCSRQTCNTENSRYEVGKKYTYHYNAATATWINGTSEQKSSLKFDCKAQIDVISLCELTLTLKEVGMFESNANGDIIVATNQAPLANELQEHVLRFGFNDGVVTDVCPSAGEKMWALNFKRGFLSAIQAPVTAELEEAIMTMETDVTGRCPVRVAPSAYPDSIMKYKDLNKCEERTKLEGGIEATMLESEAAMFSILESSQECEVSFQSNIVSESVCEERHVSKAFSKQSSGAMTHVRVTVDDLDIAPAVAPANTLIDRRTTILFEHGETKRETQQEILFKAKENLGSIGRRLNKRVGVEMPNLFSDLVTEMRKIETLAGMTELRQFVEGESEALVRVFKDALPMCETTPSIETMVIIINKVAASSDEEAKKNFKPTRAMWLSLPAVINHPKKEMISAMMPLVKTLSVEESVFFLPISSLINRYCTSENPSCLEETEVRQAIEYFQQLLGYDCTPTEEVPALKMLMALKALTNARHLSTDSKISIINKCFDHHSPTKGMEIRVAALELVRRLPCKPEYQTYAKAMYKNQHFDSELRIAAYRAIVTCPSHDIMAAIQEVMMEEESDQVGSYVWTHLSNLNETSDPQKQHLKKWVQNSGIMGRVGKKDLRKFSRNVELSWYNDEMASGLTIDADMIFSSQSFLPRELRLNSTVEAFGYAINLFEIGGRLEGMHQILESYFGPRGFFKENSVQDLVQGYQQKQQEAFLNSLPDAGEVTLPEGLPEGVTLEMYTQLLRMLQFQQKMFGGKLPLPIPGQPMPEGMPKGMTQEIYDDLLVVFMRDGLPEQRKKRHLIKESSINEVESEYHAHVENQPRASLYLKMFGNELAYLDIAKIRSRLTEMKSSMNPMKVLMNLAQEQTHELSKNAVLMDCSWTVPTVVGLPLKIAINGTVSVKVRTEGKIDMRGILMAPRSFEINGVIEPSAALEVSTSMEVTARRTRSGLNHVSRLHSSISLGGKIQVTNGKAFVVQVNVPDQKQEILDISSSIYLRLQDESLEMPGIPERLEKSYCSGPITTKFFGGQVCTELAFPKSYARTEYPLYPLTGPAHMRVTLEKTDPSLTSWKLEGSYGLEKETVNGVHVKTDRFHLMFGAPDTDIPRTFQADFSYNRNDMEMNFNVITPMKTIDVNSKAVNDEVLRKLEVSITLDKTDVYTLDTEVESSPSVVDGDMVITFYPRMDITSPNGMVVKYRSSIGVRDGQQSRVNMWMSLDSPQTALVTVSGDVVKTESTKKVRYSSDLQISGRYVNVNVSTAWQKQKRDNVITVDATILRRVGGEIVKDIIISAKYTNRTNENQMEWDLKTEWTFARYPLLSFLFETEYVGTSSSSEATSKLCYRYNGQECGQDTKVIMGHLLTWESTESTINENFNFKIRNPANKINLEIQQHAVRNTSHPLDFSVTILNNTSEMEVINAAIRTRTLSEEPIKGDFEASLRSQTWRYAVLQDWEFVEGGKVVLNTAAHWEDQRATFVLNYTPTRDEEINLKRHDINFLLTYPLGSLSANMYTWREGNDVSHGASASLIDQSLFAYQLEFTNHTVDAMHPNINLHGSFNITRPVSPISVVLRASIKDQDINGGFNITLGNVKAFTSGVSLWDGTGEDMLPKQVMMVFVDVDIPQKDYSLSISQSSTMTPLKSEDEQRVLINSVLVYYRKVLINLVVDEENNRLDIAYDYSLNMSYPLPEMDVQISVNVINGNQDHKVVVHRAKVPILFLKVNYDSKMLEADENDPQNSILEETQRHEVKIIFRTPMVIMKDVRWNGTLDLAPTTFNFDTRLFYFPNQERPFVMTINYQNKSSELVSHNQLTTTFETIKRRINIFNMAKFDLGSGTVLGSSSVEFGVHDTKPAKFEVNVEYTNKTEDGTISNKLVLTLNSPDNTIETESTFSYIEETKYTTTFSILVSEKSIFGVNIVIRNDSDITQKSFDVDSTFNFFEEQFRVHTVHSQDANSFHPNIKVYRANGRDPMVEADVSYNKISLIGETHSVIVTLKSEDTEPFTINTVYTDRSNTKNIGVIISTSQDKHLDLVFNLVTGSSDTERETYDVTFEVDNTYLPNRQFEVTAHFGLGDNQYNLNSDLKISELHLMNIMYACEHSSPSQSHTLKNTRLRLTFPQMSDYPVLSNLALHLDTETQPEVMTMRKTEFRWGRLTDDEAVILKLTRRSNMLEVMAVHPMDLPPLPKEITVVLRNNTIPTARKSFEIQVNGEVDNLMIVSGSYALIDDNENKRRAFLSLTRPNREDIQLTLDTEVNNDDKIFGSTLLISYSEDETRLVNAMIEVVNTTDSDSTGFDVNMALRHLVSGLDMSTALTIINDKTAMSAGIEGEILVGNTPEPFNFEVSWNKKEEKYTVISQTPWRKMVFTGHFEDRSYSDYQIYRVTMTNTYNDDRVVRSMIEYNSQLKEISYIANPNPDNPEDFLRFRAGFLNETALIALLDSETDGKHSVDAKLLIALQSPKILQTHLQWNPNWAEYVHGKSASMYEKMIARIELRREDMTASRESLAIRIQMAWDDFLLSNVNITNTLEDMRERLLEKYEAKKERMELMLEDFKTRSENYWSQLEEDWKPCRLNLETRYEEMRVKFEAWAVKFNGTADEYIKTTTRRVKAFYNTNVKPLFEELKELFETLTVQHEVQWDILFPQIRPYGEDYLIPEKIPRYWVGGKEDVGEPYYKPDEMILETYVNVPGEKEIGFTPENNFYTRFERLGQLRVWRDVEKLWNETKVELEAIFAEIDEEFKQSNFYMDLVARLEELKERFPIEQWREETEAKIDEFRESDEAQELIKFFELIKEELVDTGNVTKAGLIRIRDRLVEALGAFNLDILEYLKRPTYEVIHFDLENGEILFLLHLPTEVRSFQQMPESLRQWETIRQLQDMIAEVRERSKNTLGEIAMADGTIHSMYELMFNEPMLMYREGNLSEWFQGERIKAMRNLWEMVHLGKFYLNPVNWIPPHEANAMIVGGNHYVTFDRTFYDFSSGCSYLLAHDFIDGNFTVIVEYSREGSSGGRSMSIVLYLNTTTSFEIRSDFTVFMGKQLLELPVQYGRTTIMRYANSIRIHNTNGVTITCDIAYDNCNVNVSGWYFGKTAGLLGTYNYEANDDFTTADGDMARHVDDFTRSWKVGKKCAGSSTDPLPECNSDPEEETNLLCSANFLDAFSSLTECYGVVDPAPYYAMCSSKMCELSDEERQEEACKSVKAYVDDCNRLNVGIVMPDSCVVCDAPDGKFSQSERKVLADSEVIPKSADVVLIVEEKMCNADLLDHVGDIVDILDTELRNTREFSDNRFGLLGFGGEGVHDLAHIHTIDGKLFNTMRSLIQQGFPELQFAEDGNNNTFAAILAAANYPFRAGVAKNIILLSCSNCQRRYHMKTYSDVASLLIRQGIQFNILMNSQLELVPGRAKNTSPKNTSPKNQVIYGIDNRTVFTNKALSSGSLIGDKSIRKLINEPVNQCALLAYESGGALFDSSKIEQKKFVDVLTQRMVQHTIVEQCQVCSCTAGNDGVGRAVCESCRIAEIHPWLFDMQRAIAETNYYGQHGMQSIMDYINTPDNKTPKILPWDDLNRGWRK